MNTCTRPLDPVDADALASGAPPVIRADASEHARGCADCAQAVDRASRFAGELDSVGETAGRADIAGRVLRLRTFSPRERRSFSVWRAPVLEGVLLLSAGVLCLFAPGVSPREQAGLGMAAAVPLVAFLRALGRSLGQGASSLPAGLDALSGALRGSSSIGLAALLLLLPAAAGLKRAFARSTRR